MQDYKIISKYDNKIHIHDFVSVSNYIIAEKAGARYLLLKCYNDRKQKIDRITVKFDQLDERKKLIKSQELTLTEFNGYPQDYFAIDKKIEIAENCEGIKIEVTEITFGDFVGVYEDEEVLVKYLPVKPTQKTKIEKLKKELNKKQSKIENHNFKSTMVLSVISSIIVALFAVLLLTQLILFKFTADTFTHQGIKYEFVDGTNSKDGDILITGYSGDESEITITETLDGHKVLSIEEGAFKDNLSLEELIIEGDIAVKNQAFYGCANLKSVQLIGVKSIGANSFSNSGIVNLKSDALVVIGRGAFSGCSALTELDMTLPEDEVLDLGSSVFMNCSSLTEFEVPNYITAITPSLFEGCTELKKVILHDQIKLIANRAFAGCTKLASIKLISSIETIGEGAFAQSGLTSIDVPKNVLSIGKGAFSGCESLLKYTACFIGGSRTENRNLSYVFIDESNQATSKFPSKLATVNINNTQNETALHDNAFRGCSSVQTIKFQKNITSIGKNAFYGCESLKTLNYSKVTTIGDYAFYGCKSLKSFSIKQTLTKVGKGAFYGCESLESINIPSWTTFGEGAFEACTGLKNFAITFAEDGLSTFSLPRLFGESGVPSVLESITINGDGEIAESAFEGCTGLKNIALNGNITKIGEKAFKNCYLLDDVILPSTLQSIDTEAFAGCRSLTFISIPSSVRTVSTRAFVDNYLLFEIENLSDAIVYSSNALNIYNKPEDKMVQVETGDYAVSFRTVDQKWYLTKYPSDQTDIVLPSLFVKSQQNITVDKYALPKSLFRENSSVVNVVIPSSVIELGDNLFTNASSLQTVEFDVNNTNITEIYDGTFKNCKNLTKVSLPNAVQRIGVGAFSDNENLTEINMPTSLVEIANNAFRNTHSLQNVVFPSTLSKIGRYAFYCSNLQSVSLSGNLTEIYDYTFYNNPSLTSVSLPNSIIKIGDYAFSNNTALTQINLPTSLSQIGNYAFEKTSSLQAVEFPNTLTSIGEKAFYESNISSVVLTGEITEIKPYTFYNNASLTTVNLPDTLEILGEYAFADCASLQSVVLSNNLLSIEPYTFYNAVGLKEITLPTALVSIKEKAFYNSGLTSLSLSNNVSLLEKYAFAECKNLSTLTVTSTTLEKIEEYAFANDTSLSTVNLGEGVKIIGKYAFYDNTSLTQLTMSGVEIIYQNAFANSAALTELSLPTSLKKIGEKAFYDSGLTSITFNEGLEDIGKYAFAENENLAQITFPSTLKLIDNNAFENNRALTTIDLSSSIVKIGDYAFYNNTSVKSITLADNLQAIGKFAFGNLDKLNEIVLPSSLVKIGNSAFLGCNNIYEVVNQSTVDLTESKLLDYALAVYASTDEPSRIVDIGSFIFTKQADEWMLRRITYINTADKMLKFPSSFDYLGEQITSYAIHSQVLDRVDISGYEAIYLPEAVNNVEQGALFGLTCKIFCKTEGQREALLENNPNANYYTYVDCVHGENQWTGDFNTTYSTYTQNIAPNCQSEGKTEIYCSANGHLLSSEAIAQIGHEPNDRGSCKTCDKVYFAVNEYFMQKGFTNDTSYPFRYASGIVSTNTSPGTFSKLTYSTSKNVNIRLTITASCGAEDKFSVYKNNQSSEPLLSVSLLQTASLDFNLNVGELLLFVYEKSASQAYYKNQGIIETMIITQI